MAHVARQFGDIHGKHVVFLFGFVFPCRAPLRMYLFGTMKGHYGPFLVHFKDCELGASCIVLCFWKRGVFSQFLWPMCLVS